MIEKFIEKLPKDILVLAVVALLSCLTSGGGIYLFTKTELMSLQSKIDKQQKEVDLIKKMLCNNIAVKQNRMRFYDNTIFNQDKLYTIKNLDLLMNMMREHNQLYNQEIKEFEYDVNLIC